MIGGSRRTLWSARFQSYRYPAGGEICLCRTAGGIAAAAGLRASWFISSQISRSATLSRPCLENQLQAMQMTMFFLLPAILLSGFAFQFAGMPAWAQGIGEVLPATRFLRIVRGILLKDNGTGRDMAKSLAFVHLHFCCRRRGACYGSARPWTSRRYCPGRFGGTGGVSGGAYAQSKSGGLARAWLRRREAQRARKRREATPF